MTTKPQTRWTAQEEDFLVRNYQKNGPAWCSEYLGRTPGSVACKAQNMGLQIFTIAKRGETPPAPHTRHTCADCGRPTPDHRCPQCWAKLRAEGGYSDWNRVDASVYGVMRYGVML